MGNALAKFASLPESLGFDMTGTLIDLPGLAASLLEAFGLPVAGQAAPDMMGAFFLIAVLGSKALLVCLGAYNVICGIVEGIRTRTACPRCGCYR